MLTRLSRHVSDAFVSPSGKWLAFRRNSEIWIAPFDGIPVTDDRVRKLSADGGDSFAFTADSSNLIYSSGNKVWLQPITGGERRQIPVRLELPQLTPKPLLLRGARVLDFNLGSFGPPTSMLIEHGRIAWCGPENAHHVPGDAEVIDCDGRFAIPGLFDFQVLTAGHIPAAFLAYGITSARDIQREIFWMNAMKDRSDFTNDPVPRYFISGGMFEGEHPREGDSSLLISDEKSAREYVRRIKEWGGNFIGLYRVNGSLPWPLQRAVADEAHQLGLPVMSPAFDIEEITKAATLGFFSVDLGHPEHVGDDVIQMLSLSGTHWDPLTVVSGSDALLLRAEPEKLLDPKFQALTSEQSLQEALLYSYMKNVDDLSLRGYVANLLARVYEAHRRGVKLHVGSGAREPECFPGKTLHWEMARFVEAGLTPLEVLRIATEEAAAAVGAGDLGTLAPGKIADVVLLSADPLQDIHNTEAIWRVIKGGWLFDPDKLAAQSATPHRELK
jgi:imidazolonepropionase-like amidohydrolase